ncbi:glycosyltransferase [Burkholderiaceae bacterium FT117]|uniref:glycosyltransferase n=1 Tax=Zeimonas sediminis TaxID=2944268 RepID=UPI002342F0F1|nr:glycosyltransferase [Zeimonas sediminis]MCM5572376.1 glycosyltransferase [Zeimonas sediminis]
MRRPASPLEPTVSVVLPVYLGGPDARDLRLLLRALDSAIEQDYPSEWEIVLVDDGSPVPVRDLLSGAPAGRHPRLRTVRMAANCGLVHALNAGLANARFDLVARLDADDAWMPGKVARQLARFARNPDLTLVATGMRVVFDSGAPPFDDIRRDGWPEILRFAVERGCPFPHGSVLARRDVYLALGGYSHSAAVRHAEDFDLWARWIRFFEPAMIEECLYEYRVSAGSVSSVHAQAQAAATQATLDALRAHTGLADCPGNVRALGRALGVDAIGAGLAATRIWKHRPASWLLPADAIDPLRALLPDRRLIEAPRGSSAAPLCAGRLPVFPGQAAPNDPRLVEVY